jgi:hypothetical protein
MDFSSSMKIKNVKIICCSCFLKKCLFEEKEKSMSHKRPPTNNALAALRGSNSAAKKEQNPSIAHNPQLFLASGNTGGSNAQLQQTQEQQQQVPCFDGALYVTRHFFTESGIGSRDGRPVVPIPGQRNERQFQRVHDSAKLLCQWQGSWRTAYPDDPKRGAPSDGAIVPNSRFPTELSAFGQPIRKPKIKLAGVSSAESKLMATRSRRRQRDGEGKDAAVGPPNKKKNSGGADAGGSGGAGGVGGGGDGSGKDGAGGGKDKENAGLDDEDDDANDDDDDDDDDYSNGNGDDDDEDYGGGGGDDELAF